MKKQYKRYLSMLISLCMLFTLIPTTAFASITMTNVPNQQVQYGIALGEDQDEISETEVVDVTIALKGTPYINAEAPTDIILTIDKSGSMGNDVVAMAEAAEVFVERIDLSVHRVGLIIYDNTVTDDCKIAPTDDEDVLIEKLREIPSMNQGGTNIDTAINESVKLLDSKRSNAEGAIVLMTDGESDLPSALAAAEKAKMLNYSFFTVALCDSEDSEENKNLKKMATSEADHYSVFETSQLNSVYSNIASKIGDVNAKDIVITQAINGQFDLVAGSTDDNIPLPTINGNSLVWTMTQLVRGDVTLTYQMKPKASIPEGTYNHAVGYIFYTDYNGNRQKMEIPMQEIVVSHNGPIITSITPDRVEYTGGETVTIKGEYFRPGLQIYLDGDSIPYKYISANELQFTMPQHEVDEKVRVMVRNPNGKSVYKNIAVYAQNILTSVTPNTVEENRKQPVTIKGSGFNGNSKTADVYFGDKEAAIKSITNDTITCVAPALPAGVYEVKVVNADDSVSTLAAAYTSEGVVTVVNPCTITSVTPNTVEEDTAQKVTITGTEFNGNSKTMDVMVGTTEATIFSVDEDNGIIVCRIPKLSAGTYDITVINADDTTATLAGAYTVVAEIIPPCTITSVSPNTAVEETKQRVTISGTMFNGTSKTADVYFGNVEASIISIVENEVICIAPALPVGVYDVKIINADNTTASLTGAYTVEAEVIPPCTITSITPATVDEDTAQNVTIIGTMFNGSSKTAEVYFGSEKATITSVDETKILCKAPALAPGVYDVKVINGDNTTATLAGAYTVNDVVEPTCTITSVNPTSVAANTRVNIFIYGTEFNGNSKTADVFIGTEEANIFSVDADNGVIKCRIPRLPAGVYDVTVVNADDTTATLVGALVVA